MSYESKQVGYVRDYVSEDPAGRYATIKFDGRSHGTGTGPETHWLTLTPEQFEAIAKIVEFGI